MKCGRGITNGHIEIGRKIGMELTIIVVVILLLLFGDLITASRGMKPRFAIPFRFFKDGGSTDCIGLLYTVRYHNVKWVAVNPDADGAETTYRTKGPEYRHSLFPIHIKSVSDVRDQLDD